MEFICASFRVGCVMVRMCARLQWCAWLVPPILFESAVSTQHLPNDLIGCSNTIPFLHTLSYRQSMLLFSYATQFQAPCKRSVSLARNISDVRKIMELYKLGNNIKGAYAIMVCVYCVCSLALCFGADH